MAQSNTEILNRRPSGFVHISEKGSGKTVTYAAIQYEVTERIRTNEGYIVRTRMESGAPHENGDLSLAFSVAMPAIREIERRCIELEAARPHRSKRVRGTS